MTALVDIDVASRTHRVHARHRLDRGRVTAATAAALARVVTVPPSHTDVEPPPAALDVPFELLLGSGEAVRLGRDDVLSELMRRFGRRLETDHVRRLHTGSVGRMRAVVVGVGPSGARRVGWVSWSLFADGWRALTPHSSRGVAMVRVHPVEPLRLGVEVARLVTAVRR